MPVTINGSTGVSLVQDSTITSAKILDGTIANTDINASAAIEASKLSGTGKVLQVVTSETTTTTTTTGSSFVATNLSASITPNSTSSRIVILATAMLNNTSSNSWAYGTIYRDSTDLGPSNTKGLVGVYSQGGDIHVNGSIVLTDSPNTTSAVTYKYYIRAYGGTAKFNQQSQKTKITLMEIGA